MTKILLIEDDETIRLGVKYFLEQEGYQILEGSNCKEGLNLIDESVELILLDVNLPDGSGFDLLKEIKKTHDIPIIFLTASDMEISIIMGLDMGADDYITKPFKARELLARIKTVLRRINKESENIITIHDITIDVKSAKVFKKQEQVFLTALEYRILLILALNPNQVFTREQILSDIWDVNEEYVNDNTLTVYIKRIREKLEETSENPKIIKTVRGIGYKVGD